MAKLYASEVAVRCANEGVQIHGGYGFIKDYPAEKFYRDVKLCTIGEGHERNSAAGDCAAVAERLAAVSRLESTWLHHPQRDQAAGHCRVWPATTFVDSRDERTIALLAHMLQIMLWWIAPLAIFPIQTKLEVHFLSCIAGVSAAGGLPEFSCWVNSCWGLPPFFWFPRPLLHLHMRPHRLNFSF